jgi:hypothetical protein
LQEFDGVAARKTREQVAAAFNTCNLHDDSVHAIRIIPATSRRSSSRVELDLTEYVTNRPRRLALTGCANISFVADFDVLVDNAFANTEGVQASVDEERIREIIARGMGDLNVEYTEGGQPSEDHPARLKLRDAAAYVLFRVTFYGGTLEVIGRGFKISRPRPKAAQS